MLVFPTGAVPGATNIFSEIPFTRLHSVSIWDMDTGTYLRKLRVQKGLSLGDVVEKSLDQVDKTTLSRVERNERGVSLATAYLLAKIYGEDFETFAKKLLSLKGIKPPKK